MTETLAAPTVVVLAGGLSHERDVSLRSGRRVSQALRSGGLEVIESDVDSALLPRLADLPGAVVFPVLHGEAGEDGALREVFALLEVPFVGSIASACRVAFDKSIATTVVADAELPTPRQVALPHETFRELGASALVRALGDQIGFPMMVKPSRSASAAARSAGPRNFRRRWSGRTRTGRLRWSKASSKAPRSQWRWWTVVVGRARCRS
jgi:D-alanine-D-alanine ligase